ncbi:MAG: hypothetical protein ACR2MM_07005 [Flavobacteriaceae bacterium]
MEEETLEQQNKRVAEYHRHCQKWSSLLFFTKDELIFIRKLLNSYVFEPTTPNLFERLQDYLARLDLVKTQLDELDGFIHSHEYELGGILECATLPSDIEISEKHMELTVKIEELQGKFRMLKSEIFNYAGGILKKRKEP